MAEQGILALFDEPAPQPKAVPAPKPDWYVEATTPRSAASVPGPAEDEAITLALAYEAAVLAALATFDEGDIATQKAACVAFVGAMEPFMALGPLDHKRGQREINKRGRVSDHDWRLIRDRMVALLFAR